MNEQTVLALVQLGLKVGPSIGAWLANRKSEDELVEDFRALVKEQDFSAWAADLKAQGQAILDG